ncbi:MAG: CPBP family intramembrane glutamic endopeptidase, partial [Armatimonadota bacterium]
QTHLVELAEQRADPLVHEGDGPVATFGEEFGSRGYLQPRLSRLGRMPSMVAVGAIWGIWHAPGTALAGCAVLWLWWTGRLGDSGATESETAEGQERTATVQD